MWRNVAQNMDWVAHGPEGLLLSMEEVRSLLLRSVNFKFVSGQRGLLHNENVERVSCGNKTIASNKLQDVSFHNHLVARYDIEN